MNRKYTEEHIEFIRENIPGCPFKELTDMFNERFGLALTVSAMVSLANRYGLHNGRNTRFDNWLAPAGVEYRFPKGHVPHNKGKKGISYPGTEVTQFKKGNRPHNWVPIGSERITKNGYIQVKIQEGKFQRNWKGKHILIWEEANGPLPEGHVIIFGDGNNRNFNLDNLLLVSRKQLVRMNQKKLIQNDAKLTKTGVIIADIYNKIGERKKRRRSKGI